MNSDIFSDTYSEAREKFIDASEQAGAFLHSFKNPSKGPSGGELFTDIALSGNTNAENFIVLISGTHGVEGFAGSAVQTGLLQSDYISQLPDSTGLLFIHALNPYGFAHLRRYNEDNIDLNRNFFDYHNPQELKNAGYTELANAISPESISLWSNCRSILHFLWYGLRHGRGGLQQAISAGQYTHSKGLFYGGSSQTWSSQVLRKIAGKYLAGAKRVIVIDFHTGLGSYGYAEVITNESPLSDVYRRALNIWGARVASTVSGESVSINTTGSLKLTFPKMLPNAEVTNVSLEFGTVSVFKVFEALRSENWFHHHSSSNSAEVQAAKNKLLRAFYPEDEDWKQRVWLQGREAFVLALAEFALVPLRHKNK